MTTLIIIDTEEEERPALMLTLYSALLVAVLVVGSPFWLLRMLTTGRYRAGFAQRLGRLPKGLREAVAGREVIWLHAVSVGEVLAATGLVAELRVALPGVVVAVSTTTQTGQELARGRFPDSPVFYLPLDFAAPMRRLLAVLRPRLVVLMESELWPNMIDQCRRAGIPIAVANARVSDRSLPRYLRLRRLWRPLLAEVGLSLAQSDASAARLVQIGAPRERVRMTGNLKYDVRAGEPTPLVRLLSERLPGGVPVVVCGSTLDGEEVLVRAAWREAGVGAVLLIAPRHPARFDAVAALFAGDGLVRASGLAAHASPIEAGSVVLLDTIGDLATAYALATVAFVGGSLVPRGGHNPLEPAQFGVPLVIGESYENFREIVETMHAAQAIRIVTPEALAATLSELLGNPTTARELGDRGRQVFLGNAGATARTAEALLGLLR